MLQDTKSIIKSKLKAYVICKILTSDSIFNYVAHNGLVLIIY